jgi:hypothetical protein
MIDLLSGDGPDISKRHRKLFPLPARAIIASSAPFKDDP